MSMTSAGRFEGWGLNHHSLVWWLMLAVSQADPDVVDWKISMWPSRMSWAFSQNDSCVLGYLKKDNQAKGVSFLWPNLRSHITSLMLYAIVYISHVPTQVKNRGHRPHFLMRGGKVLEEHMEQWPIALVISESINCHVCTLRERKREWQDKCGRMLTAGLSGWIQTCFVLVLYLFWSQCCFKARKINNKNVLH